jgi:hypothetical protein
MLKGVAGKVLLSKEVHGFFVEARMACGSFSTNSKALFSVAPSYESLSLPLESVELFVGWLYEGGCIENFA